MHEELDDVHLLPRELVSDGGAGGVAVGPGAAVDQVHRAALGWGLIVSVAVVETAVPAVEGPGQGRALHLHVYPVAGGGHKRALSAHGNGTHHDNSKVTHTNSSDAMQEPGMTTGAFWGLEASVVSFRF